jgi:nitrite reductase/ring-hydroxylating ferredoxin subunit/uncharacterized membrane protein
LKSRASYKAHPIHPALIPFPFAFLMGALLFDALGALRDSRTLWTTGAHLALVGIAAGLMAAVPGAIDYLYSVPPKSSARTRATKHAIGNLTALLLFGAAWLLRGNDWSPGPATIGLELFGAALLAYSGSLGGTLITRNLISVDHRHANAGKWQEASFTARAGEPIAVGHVDDLKDDQMKLLHVNGRRIVLARTAGGYQAFDDRCTHRGGSLADGALIDGTVQCLWHGSQFEAGSGAVRCGPAKKPIGVYELKETKNGQLLLVAPPH